MIDDSTKQPPAEQEQQEELPGKDAIHMNLSELLPADDSLFGGKGQRRTNVEKIIEEASSPLKPRSGRDRFS